MIRVIVQPQDFDPADEFQRLGRAGALSTFTGHVRGDGGLVEMNLEHYPEMTERSLSRLAAQATERWPLLSVTVIHRYGALAPGDRIVFVGTASSHRAAAIEACSFLIDQLKTAAPFWKQERFADGTERWVEARESDDEAAARWD